MAAGPDRLGELVEVQKDMLRWIRFASLPQLKSTLESVLTTDTDRQVFQMSDGKTTSRTIGAALGIGKTTVTQKWVKWAPIGIVERLQSGQYRRICSLEDVGIEAPQAPRSSPQESVTETQGGT